MKNKYTIAYIGAIIALPVALLFIVPAVATTNASVWSTFDDAQASFTAAQDQAFADFGNDADFGATPVTETAYTFSTNDVSGSGVSASASSGSTGSSGAVTGSEGGSAWATNSGYANAQVSVDLGCTDCETPCVDVPPPTCTLDVLPATIHEGETVKLLWDTTNATAVSIAGIGGVALDGSKDLKPTYSQTYTLTAQNAAGVAKCTKTVQVIPTVIEHPAPTCTFSVNPASITQGSSATMTWDTTNATAVSIADIGTVTVDGSKVVYPTQSRNYVLTATGAGGTVTCTDDVGVTPHENGNTTSTTTFTNVNNNYNYNYNSYSGGSSHNNNDDDVSCDSFTVSDAHVEEGETVTLKWKTTDADDVDIDHGVGDVNDDGSEEVKVTRDTTFKLTARNNGSTDTCRVSVTVDEDEDDDNDELRCEFSVSDSAIRTGESTILSWINDAADRLVLKEGTKTLADSKKDSDIDEDVDVLTVKPTKTTKYTLDVYKGNKKETCVLNVEVGKGTVSGISLSQVPYTGFEAGPMLTAIFYGAIVLWGLVLAYALVLKKKHSRILSK